MIESEVCLNNPHGQCKHVLTEQRVHIRDKGSHLFIEYRCVLTGAILHKFTLTDGILPGRVACSHFQVVDVNAGLD